MNWGLVIAGIAGSVPAILSDIPALNNFGWFMLGANFCMGVMTLLERKTVTP